MTTARLTPELEAEIRLYAYADPHRSALLSELDALRSELASAIQDVASYRILLRDREGVATAEALMEMRASRLQTGSLARSLEAERARPRPPVEWSEPDMLWRDVEIATMFPYSPGDGTVRWRHGLDRAKSFATEAEARAALVDAAEAAGFDVSACKEKE